MAPSPQPTRPSARQPCRRRLATTYALYAAPRARRPHTALVRTALLIPLFAFIYLPTAHGSKPQPYQRRSSARPASCAACPLQALAGRDIALVRSSLADVMWRDASSSKHQYSPSQPPPPRAAPPLRNTRPLLTGGVPGGGSVTTALPWASVVMLCNSLRSSSRARCPNNGCAAGGADERQLLTGPRF